MRPTRLISSLGLAVAALCLSVAPAGAADQIYWGNEGGEQHLPREHRRRRRLDIPITGVSVEHPEGLAIDAAAGRVYWVNRDELNYSIRFANLDGSGGGILNTAVAPVVRTTRPRDLPGRAAGSTGPTGPTTRSTTRTSTAPAAANSTRPGRWSNSPSASPSTRPRTGSTGRTSTGRTERRLCQSRRLGRRWLPRPDRGDTRRHADGRSPSTPRPTASTGRTPAFGHRLSPSRTEAKAVRCSPTGSR